MAASEFGIVLPPREGFSPGAVGAIGLLVHRLCRAGLEGVVAGRPCADPFDDVRFRPAPPGWGLGRPAQYAAGVARALRGARLLEVHNRPNVAIALQRRMPGVKVVLVLNNDPLGMRSAGRALRQVDRVVAASHWIAGRVGVPVTVIPNCMELPATRPEFEGRDRLILFAGRLVADKGADSFVAACASALPLLPGWRAEMIGADRFSPGSADTPFIDALRPRAAAAGVVLRGYLPHADVMAAMRRAAVVVVPSRWEEPFGLAALEAFVCGAPLVCSRRGGLPEIADESAAYVDPERPGDIAAALVELATHPERREALARAGWKRARLFSAAEAVAAFRALRAEVLEG